MAYPTFIPIPTKFGFTGIPLSASEVSHIPRQELFYSVEGGAIASGPGQVGFNFQVNLDFAYAYAITDVHVQIAGNDASSWAAANWNIRPKSLASTNPKPNPWVAWGTGESYGEVASAGGVIEHKVWDFQTLPKWVIIPEDEFGAQFNIQSSAEAPDQRSVDARRGGPGAAVRYCTGPSL